MIRKIFMAAVVMLTTSTAFAKATPVKSAPNDGGVQQYPIQFCDGGFVVKADEAHNFNLTFGAIIVATSSVTDISKLIPESEQAKDVVVLERLDKIDESKKEGCLKVSHSEADLLVHHLLLMTNTVSAKDGGSKFDQFMLLVTHDDKAKASALIEQFRNVLKNFVVVAATQ